VEKNTKKYGGTVGGGVLRKIHQSATRTAVTASQKGKTDVARQNLPPGKQEGAKNLAKMMV